jgi:hypothetical protein
VLDARSGDRTVEFARAAGARVVERDWTSFPEARTYALSLVRTPWTFMLDADEALDDALRDAVLAASGEFDGYVVRRTTFYCGKALRMWRGEPLVRLFRTERARLESRGAAVADAPLHERWLVDGATAELSGTLLHYSYPDAASYRAKYERYTALEAAMQRFSLGRVMREWFASWAHFLWLLLRRGALLDGPRGIAAAFHSARYRYVAAKKAR